MEDDALGVGEETSFTVNEPEPGVVEGGVPGTEVGWTWAGGVEVEGEGGLTVPELDPPLVMVKVGEMFPELPITKFNITLAH